jgi:DNA polymerase III delta subunit
MLLYLYGSDSYRRGARLRYIIDEFKKKYPEGTMDRFDGAEKDALDRLAHFTKDQSLFAKVKLGILENADEADGVVKILKSVIEDRVTTLVIVSEKKLPKEFAFLLKEPSRAEAFDDLELAAQLLFIKKEALLRNLKITDGDIKNVVNSYGTDTWGILNELEKIDLGSTAEHRSASPQFFGLVQALKSSSRGSRLSALGYLLKNEEPAAVFNVLASIASGELKVKMADYDVAIKSGKMEYEEALTDLVISN